MSSGPKILAFAAPSGTGKTTLICKVIAELNGRGLEVGTIKSDAHRVELDTPGKDTHRMRSSGSATTAIISRNQLAVFQDGGRKPSPIHKIVDVFFSDVDLVLAEGFRSQGLPTIVVSRKDNVDPKWELPSHVVAIASDHGDIDSPNAQVFALDDLKGLSTFLCEYAGLTPPNKET